MNGDTIRTHYGNGTAVPSEFMGGEVVEVEQEPEITQTYVLLILGFASPDFPASGGKCSVF